jgi:membrane-associated protease RseP (regulator of RpoE activity)
MNRLLAISSVATLLLSQAAFLRAQDSPEPKKESARAFTLRVTGDGHVEMSVKENGEDKTYKADSMDEFVRKYPEVAREYGVGRGGLKAWRLHEPGEFSKKFEEWRKQFGNFDFGTQDPELKKLLEHPEQFFQGHAAPKAEAPEPAPRAEAGPRLGVRLAPLSQVLADQLGVDVNGGALIADIEAGSLAEKSGLRKNDILVKVDGKDASALESLRAAVQDALKKKEFDVEILRQGKPQTVKVTPPTQK